MRSSTSSSEPAAFARSVPQGNWWVSCLIAVVLAAIAMVAWESRVRAMGYAPSVNDTSDLWASQRERLDGPGVAAVVVGSSRVKYALNLEVWAELSGQGRPIQLAMAGTAPMELLESVVAAEQFTGLVLIGVTPNLWFVPQGRPVENARQAVGRYENWSPSQRAGLVLGVPIQQRMAWWNPEDLTLGSLIDRVELPMREGAVANQPPLLPPYFSSSDRYRQSTMWDRCTWGSPLALEIQRRWIPLFTPPPPPPGVTQEEFMAQFGEFMEANLERLRVAVTALRERGCDVVFVRLPSTGGLRELERKFAPREAFYDRMIAVTGTPGIHFEDYPQLSEFDCPEWSHLTGADAAEFTRRLFPLVEEAVRGM